MDPELHTLEASFSKASKKWISQQDLIFRFTHCRDLGSFISVVYTLFKRLLLLVGIVFILSWLYLSNLPSTKGFRIDLETQISTALNAGKVKVKNSALDKTGLLSGELQIGSIELEESENSIFKDWITSKEEISVVGRRSTKVIDHTAQLSGVNVSPYQITDHYFSKWSAKELAILDLEAKLKIGIDDDENIKQSYASLFKTYDTLHLESIKIHDTTLFWGESESNSGEIKNAQFKIIKNNQDWDIKIKEGTFSYAWLKNAVINEMSLKCKPSGVVVLQSASLQVGDGEMLLEADIQIGDTPEIRGRYSFENVDVNDLIGENYRGYLDGKVSGEGNFTGILSDSKGILFITNINLAHTENKKEDDIVSVSRVSSIDNNMFILRGDNIALFSLLQLQDSRNSYSLLRASKGKLNIEHQGDSTKIQAEDISFGKADLMLMNGEFSCQLEALSVKEKTADALIVDLSKPDIAESPEKDLYDESPNESSIGQVMMIKGEVNMGVRSNIFKDQPKVQEAYESDAEGKRLWLTVPLSDRIEEITEDFSRELSARISHNEEDE